MEKEIKITEVKRSIKNGVITHYWVATNSRWLTRKEFVKILQNKKFICKTSFLGRCGSIIKYYPKKDLIKTISNNNLNDNLSELPYSYSY